MLPVEIIPVTIAPIEKDMLEVKDEAMRPEFPEETRMDDDDDPTPVRKKGKRRFDAPESRSGNAGTA